MKLCLVVNEGVHKGKVIPIPLAQFLIGRDPQCHLRPSSPMISKRHCALVTRGDKVFVRDYDSTNGTAVNDEEVKGERELANNDTLKVGPLGFIVRIEISVPVDKPTPLPPPKTPPPRAKSKDNVDEESIAAMLLDLHDEKDPTKSSSEDGIPTGSTVMEIPALTGPDGQEPKKNDKPPPAKTEPPSTSVAAKAILEKYTRRRRTPSS